MTPLIPAAKLMPSGKLYLLNLYVYRTTSGSKSTHIRNIVNLVYSFFKSPDPPPPGLIDMRSATETIKQDSVGTYCSANFGSQHILQSGAILNILIIEEGVF
jgi:hypothetical protein